MKLKLGIASFVFCFLLFAGFAYSVFAQVCNNNGACDILETCATCSSDCGSCSLPTLPPILPTATPAPNPSPTSAPQPTATPIPGSSSTSPVINQTTTNVRSEPSVTVEQQSSRNNNGINSNNIVVAKKQIKVTKKDFPNGRILLPDVDAELVFSSESFDEDKKGWDIIFPNSDTNVTFNFNALLEGGKTNKEVVLPEKISIQKPVGEENLTITIPKDSIISASHLQEGSLWDGKFDGPKLLSAPQSCVTDKKVQIVFGVGREDLQIVFSKLVEITIPARFQDQSAFCFDKQVKEIKNPCTQSSVNDCFLIKEKNLVIKTNHFTQFITYDKPFPVIALALISLLGLLIILLISIYLFVRLHISENVSSEYISKTAHELKTPMSAIKGYLSMILRGDFGPVQKDLKEPLENMSNSTENLLNLTNDVLDVSKLKSGKLKLSLSKFSVDKLINDVIVELIPLAKEKSIELKSTSKESAKMVYADEGRVKEILINLVGNAIKFTDKGGIEISTEAEKKNLNVYVKDSGVGISKESQDKLFKKFEELGQKAGVPKGTGLGLYISKEIAKKMGGDLWLKQSEENVGSTFAFSLPLSELA